MGASHKWAFAALEDLAVSEVLECGVDVAVIRFVRRRLTRALNDYFHAAGEVANAKLASIATPRAYCASPVVKAWPPASRWLPWWQRLKQGSPLSLPMGGLITVVLEPVVGRARLGVLIEVWHCGHAAPCAEAPINSFPTSHDLAAIAAACVLASAPPPWRTPLVVLAATAGLVRKPKLEHFPSGVLASTLAATGCVRFLAPRLQGALSQN